MFLPFFWTETPAKINCVFSMGSFASDGFALSSAREGAPKRPAALMRGVHVICSLLSLPIPVTSPEFRLARVAISAFGVVFTGVSSPPTTSSGGMLNAQT